jgi:hypothetical protein
MKSDIAIRADLSNVMANVDVIVNVNVNVYVSVSVNVNLIYGN